MLPSYIQVSHCRICKSDKLSDLKVEKSYYLLNLDQTVSLTYKVCQNCHFIFHGEYVGDEYLNRYYQKSPMLRRKEITSFEKKQNKKQSDFLSRNVFLQNKKVLEIGAHAGAFLLHLKDEYKCQVYFNELSEDAIDVLSSHSGFIDYNRACSNEKMDIIVLRHVLEHIFDLDSFLLYVKTIISQEGYLFIEVPDWSWLDEHTDPLIFEHLNQFNTHNLISLLRNNGWQCEALEKSIDADDPATPNRVQRIIARGMFSKCLQANEHAPDFYRYYMKLYNKANLAINKLVDNIDLNSTIALYPASHLTFTALNESHLKESNIVGIFDIDKKKHGKVISEIEVYPAEKLIEKNPDYIFLFTMGYEKEIKTSFMKMGLSSKVITLSYLLD